MHLKIWESEWQRQRERESERKRKRNFPSPGQVDTRSGRLKPELGASSGSLSLVRCAHLLPFMGWWYGHRCHSQGPYPFPTRQPLSFFIFLGFIYLFERFTETEGGRKRERGRYRENIFHLKDHYSDGHSGEHWSIAETQRQVLHPALI